MKGKYRGFIFDLNGTIIDDMVYHTDAWFDILVSDLGAKLSYENVKSEMYGKNSELLKRVFGDDYFDEKTIEELSINKEKKYQKLYKPNLKLISGFEEFIDRASGKAIGMAIGSAAIMFNIDFVIDNLNIRKYFQALVSADDVDKSKPDPETFLKAAEQLKVEPSSCLVFEDAPKGVEAALNAGMDVVVLTTMHDKHEFSNFDNIVGFIEDYEDPLLEKIIGKG
ncbi:HAD family phosphatase [Litoribacter alkaliphilus]|uniref:Beta-phosphoglucomutase n=1 Tax=Litoribacter ruber TaxID=702568 RepID=A0AAP2CEB1_9BACT|nr:HAD family phosphatase [Litoribacter alkaliphilus]MBS9522778.1 HAD family phosphatase [Litoribacter alkaliphilus]